MDWIRRFRIIWKKWEWGFETRTVEAQNFILSSRSGSVVTFDHDIVEMPKDSIQCGRYFTNFGMDVEIHFNNNYYGGRQSD